VQYVTIADERYRIDRFYGQFPEGFELGRVSTLAVDANEKLYIFQRNGPPVVVLDEHGSFESAWGEDLVSDPHGINIDSLGRLILVDRDSHEVIICSVDGEVALRLGHRDRPRFGAPFNHPTSAYGAADGEIYVADGYGNFQVHRFAGDGTHLQSWGAAGSGDGQFSTPHSIWVDERNRVLVVDRENDRVQVFSRDGDFLQSWSGFYHPMDICADAEGRVYVTDQTPSMMILDASGELIGRCRPAWNSPHGLARSASGNFYLTEMNPSSITRLVPTAS
jgi:peptidylglycine monooxygenase